ncbi:MAG: 16S rRNA (guanine(527)-N(7))-methyltransferase RsmG [Christensenellales bacterium]|jgi:16S rRNA (guanine527-N7)-methyltransferase
MNDAVLLAALSEVGFTPTSEQAEQFKTYHALLTEWNERVNLTAVTDDEGVAQKHFADSLLALPYFKGGERVLDLGTGAGFPGVPLLIARPEISLTLMDSVQKKLDFLAELLPKLGLSAAIVHSRAEDAAKKTAFRDGFDAVTSRAVAPMNVLIELTLPFVKPKGAALCFKGPALGEELAIAQKALSELNGKVAEVKAFTLPWGDRRLAVVQKTAPTPKKYPRQAGKANKQPLC